MKGFIQNYTGDGKCKTTAALGLTTRALGAGLKVFIIQFLKNGDYSEIKALNKMKEIFPGQLFFTQCGTERDVFAKMTKNDKIAALHGEELFFNYLDDDAFDLYILDELNTAVHFELIDEKRIITKIKSLDTHGEIVFTGRYASESLLKMADLVTEMKEIKHYFNQGVKARVGIEM